MVQKEQLEVEQEGGGTRSSCNSVPSTEAIFTVTTVHWRTGGCPRQSTIRLQGTSRASSEWEWNAGMRSAVCPSHREWGSECGHDWHNVIATV